MVPQLSPRHLVVIAWLGLTAGCSGFQPDDPTENPSSQVSAVGRDSQITAAVSAIFRASPFLRETNIRIDTLDGVVTLESDDTTRPQRELAVLLSNEVERVRGVVDRMR
jgi:osmotically-inducible protein OsmY